MLPVTGPPSLSIGVGFNPLTFTTGATTMDLSIYAKDFTQHDLFDLFPGASGGRALRDTYGRVHLVTIASRGGRTTLERYGREYMRELASRGGKAKRHKEDTQPRNVTHWDGTPERHVPYRPKGSRRRRPRIIRFFLSEDV
jgi:hypothetical protein